MRSGHTMLDTIHVGPGQILASQTKETGQIRSDFGGSDEMGHARSDFGGSDEMGRVRSDFGGSDV